MADLKVIAGGAAGLPPWLTFPSYCHAPSMSGRHALARVRVSPERALLNAAANRRQPAFELWSIILGRVPPVPNVRYSGNEPHEQGLSRLADAHACFHGLKRPMAESDQGSETLTFVIEPLHYYRFDTRHSGAMVTVARRLPVPDHLLFLTHVRLDQPPGSGDEPVLGALTHWGFVQRSGSVGSLPVDFDSRFNGRHW